MADKYVNAVGVQTIKTWIEGKFATKTSLSTLDDKVEGIIAEGGEPNTIEIVKVNGTSLVPDAQKAVNVVVPTDLSNLTNTGQDPYATEGYVDTNGGKIDVIKVNNTSLPITNKTVNIDLSDYALDTDIPTATSDLTNDSDFQTSTQVQQLIDDELANITGIDFQQVDQLPASGVKGTIYLVHNQTSSIDMYDEYVWITPTGGTAHWEKIGDTQVDLSNYWTMSSGHTNSLEAMTTTEINTILNTNA